MAENKKGHLILERSEFLTSKYYRFYLSKLRFNYGVTAPRAYANSTGNKQDKHMRGEVLNRVKTENVENRAQSTVCLNPSCSDNAFHDDSSKCDSATLGDSNPARYFAKIWMAIAPTGNSWLRS